MSDAIQVFRARKILTMDANRPEATHVAVRDGRILAVGSASQADAWGPASVDERYRDHVLMPGFVEGHAHVLAGGIWRYVYAGYHTRIDPAGNTWPALTDVDAVIGRLRQAEAALAPDEPLVAWGFDPIFLPSRRLNRHDLDAVSSTRPIAVIHSNFHLLTANSAALALARYDAGTNIEGVDKDADGQPTGELQEMAAMFPVLRRMKVDFAGLSRGETGIRDYGAVARRCGVTTVTDLFAELTDADIAELTTLTGEAGFPVRMVPALNAMTGAPEAIAERALALRARSTDKLRLGAVKIMTDGSIQGFTAQLKWPHYYKGPDNAIWNIAPDQLRSLTDILHRAGLQMHIHVNGDLASEVAIDALENTLSHLPRGDHRHVLQHCQMADAAQFRRMAGLGLCVNLFANHIHYFGDKHADTTIGPDRAARMNAARTALDLGVPLAIHSDAPVTPMGPLFTAWCAVNRLTGSGAVLGPNQKISVAEALNAITLGAAYSLKLDHEIGSIECGKRADFAVLEDDPMEGPAAALKDVVVAETVLDGRPTA